MGQELGSSHLGLAAAGAVVPEIVGVGAVEGPVQGKGPSVHDDHEEGFDEVVVGAEGDRSWGLDTACLGDPAWGLERLEGPG